MRNFFAPLGTLDPHVDREVRLRGAVEAPERRDDRARYVVEVRAAEESANAVDARSWVGQRTRFL